MLLLSRQMPFLTILVQRGTTLAYAKFGPEVERLTLPPQSQCILYCWKISFVCLFWHLYLQISNIIQFIFARMNVLMTVKSWKDVHSFAPPLSSHASTPVSHHKVEYLYSRWGLLWYRIISLLLLLHLCSFHPFLCMWAEGSESLQKGLHVRGHQHHLSLPAPRGHIRRITHRWWHHHHRPHCEYSPPWSSLS